IARNKELDLVEVSPQANPPVAKILEWSKFKYQLEKKLKESKSKRVDQKEMWFKAYIDTGDLKHKVKKVTEFLAKKHPVKLTIRAKGRTDRSNMETLINKILVELEGYIEEVVDKPKFEGRNLSIIVRPIKNLNKKKSNDEEKTKDTQSNS
ncbi:translation initiation factor IF-3, partial [Candidatus Dojkabacteria bacterium]|nr:translation initiation factor IF-3 [Candidatus Dojkabacteria bacterium]